jgi:succinate dehydrogenase/fumarate reductase flavoprotein subunit
MSAENSELSRRKFLGISSGLAGLAAIGSIPLASAWLEGKAKVDVNTFSKYDNETDVLVIGSGMAGLFAAVKAHDAGAKVMMVSKGRLGSSGQTPFAKGIFCFDKTKEKISLDEFAQKVSRSSLGTSNPVYTKQLAEHSYARVQELREWGFFDSPLYNASFSKPMLEREIPLIERVMITHLIKEEGKIVGAAGFSMDDEKMITFSAKSVILCTGAGGFKPNGFPIGDLTHDGSIMAYKIGAKITGKEFNDGHSGQTKNAAASFDGWHGMFERKPGTTGVEIHHDLGVDLNYMAYVGGNPLAGGPPGSQVDDSIKGGPYTPQEFQRNHEHDGPPPSEREDGERGGRPPGMSGTPVGGSSAGLAIHKSEGLVPINDKCESNIVGLYAAGDALGSYMSGGIYTQVGSSLAGSAVQGAIAGEAAAAYSRNIAMPTISKEKRQAIEDEMMAPLRREKGYSPAWVTQTLQGIMIPNFVLYIKKESMLQAALSYVEELRDHHMPLLRAKDMHELRLAHETANMILSAEMKLKASIMRKESRCSHYRLDYPEMDKENWQAWINISKDANGDMKLEKQNFNNWPLQSQA